jgi:hypothetical protein
MSFTSRPLYPWYLFYEGWGAGAEPVWMLWTKSVLHLPGTELSFLRYPTSNPAIQAKLQTWRQLLAAASESGYNPPKIN